jgi:hypothetical protein
MSILNEAGFRVVGLETELMYECERRALIVVVRMRGFYKQLIQRERARVYQENFEEEHAQTWDKGTKHV